MQGFHYLAGVVTLGYDSARCNGCRRCIEVCPHAVFAIEDKRARVVRRDDCMECGACALNCEPGALTVDAGVGCADGLLTQWWRRVTGARSKDSCC